MMIKCPECGKEISDKAVTCPNCGFPISENIQNEQNKSNTSKRTEIPKVENNDTFIISVDGKNYDVVKIWNESSNIDDLKKKLKRQTGCDTKIANDIVRDFKKSPNFKNKKDSPLSVVACVLALFTRTAPIAIILAIIDLAQNNKEKKHGGSIFALIFGGLVMLVLFPNIFKGGNSGNSNIGTNEKQVNVLLCEDENIAVYLDHIKGDYSCLFGTSIL